MTAITSMRQPGPADHGWEAADHPGEGSFHVWGPNPPPDFAHNHEKG